MISFSFFFFSFFHQVAEKKRCGPLLLCNKSRHIEIIHFQPVTVQKAISNFPVLHTKDKLATAVLLRQKVKTINITSLLATMFRKKLDNFDARIRPP